MRTAHLKTELGFSAISVWSGGNGEKSGVSRYAMGNTYFVYRLINKILPRSEEARDSPVSFFVLAIKQSAFALEIFLSFLI